MHEKQRLVSKIIPRGTRKIMTSMGSCTTWNKKKSRVQKYILLEKRKQRLKHEEQKRDN
jgi:hypothetical protein